MRHLLILLCLLWAGTSFAGPYVPAGDLALRQDIQRLANRGVITVPVTTWPLAWGPILADLDRAKRTELSRADNEAIDRILRRAGWETRTDELTFDVSLGAADNASRIRSFQDTPRGRVEGSIGANWISDWFSADINVQFVDSGQDDSAVRVDNSMIGAAIGNWSVSASTMNRWWGPGWDGSLILSNNARPLPALVIDRIYNDPWETKWLSWMGPWDFKVMFGQFEEDRVVPNAQFFGMRFNFRPLDTLEIGLSRSAQWCGDDRPCDVDTFVDLLLGQDNRGSGGIDESNEPGNQLAGVDFRWTPRIADSSFGFYGQLIGEDEAGGFPSRYIGQFGVDWTSYLFDRWSSLAFFEFAGTTCQFHESSKRYNCAYNHTIYNTGYRYRGRSIAHGADNDAEIFSAGLLLVDAEEQQWQAQVRFGELNGGGLPDPFNSLTPTEQDIWSIDVNHRRAFPFGIVEVGVGYESTDDPISGQNNDEGRVYVQWRSSY